MSETLDLAAVMNKKPSKLLFGTFNRKEIPEALGFVLAATGQKVFELPNRNHALLVHGVLRCKKISAVPVGPDYKLVLLLLN